MIALARAAARLVGIVMTVLIALARPLARLVGIALMALIALAGIAAAVFCVEGGHGTLSLPGLAADARLPLVRRHVGAFLSELTAHGPVAVIALLCGIGAVLLGLFLLAGCWLTPRPRRVVLAHEEAGTLGSLRRPLARLDAEHVERPATVRQAGEAR